MNIKSGDIIHITKVQQKLILQQYSLNITQYEKEDIIEIKIKGIENKNLTECPISVGILKVLLFLL